MTRTDPLEAGSQRYSCPLDRPEYESGRQKAPLGWRFGDGAADNAEAFRRAARARCDQTRCADKPYSPRDTPAHRRQSHMNNEPVERRRMFANIGRTPWPIEQGHV
ncbi:hypothetical protein GCM10009573_00330 [Agromyces bracchium]